MLVLHLTASKETPNASSASKMIVLSTEQTCECGQVCGTGICLSLPRLQLQTWQSVTSRKEQSSTGNLWVCPHFTSFSCHSMMLTPPWQPVAPVRYSKIWTEVCFWCTLSAKLSAVCAFRGLRVSCNQEDCLQWRPHIQNPILASSKVKTIVLVFCPLLEQAYINKQILN